MKRMKIPCFYGTLSASSGIKIRCHPLLKHPLTSSTLVQGGNMQFLCKLTQWMLVGLTVLMIGMNLQQPIPLLAFILALVVILPPLKHMWSQKLPPLSKGWVRGILWLTVVTIGLGTIVNVSAQEQAEALAKQKSVPELIEILQKTTAQRAPAALALGIKRDRQAVVPLIAALSSHQPNSTPETRAAAAVALGQLQDARALEPLVASINAAAAEEKQAVHRAIAQVTQKNPQLVEKFLPAFKTADEKATQILAAMGAPTAPHVIPSLKDENAMVRRHAATVLAETGDQQAIKPLVANLTDWYSCDVAGKALTKLGWQPQTAAEQVHLWVALRQADQLKRHPSQTREVLLKDVQAEASGTIEYGIYTFISLGDRSILPTLTQLLTNRGHKTMAQVYLNSGEETLKKAGEAWATAQGYTIKQTFQKAHTARWGELSRQ
jgi:HEAT repeat protein